MVLEILSFFVSHNCSADLIFLKEFVNILIAIKMHVSSLMYYIRPRTCKRQNNDPLESLLNTLNIHVAVHQTRGFKYPGSPEYP